MATDSNFSAIGGGNVSTGILGWAIPGGPALSPLQIGVWGLGSQRGVLGMIDDGTLTPGLGLPTGASYIATSAIFGAAPKTTGVGGVSATSVGVFGQAGTFAANLSPGLSCGVLGTARAQPGVMGFSDGNDGVSGTSTTAAGVLGVSANFHGVHGRSGLNDIPLVDPQNPKPDTAVGVGVFGTSLDAIGVGGTSRKSIGVLGQTGGKAPAFDVKTTYTAGVVGTSTDTTGVIGFSQSHAGVLGVSGAAPPSPSDLPPNFLAGVVGLSDQQVGVIGRSNKLAGVYGFSQNADGVVGEIPPTSAFYAGKFFGRVLVNGDLTVAGV